MTYKNEMVQKQLGQMHQVDDGVLLGRTAVKHVLDLTLHAELKHTAGVVVVPVERKEVVSEE